MQLAKDQQVPIAGLELVTLPRLEGIDTPVAADLPAFTARLAAALSRALDAEPGAAPRVDTFTWAAVFARVEAVWISLLEK